MHEYEARLLDFLTKRGQASMDEMERGTGMGRDKLVWALESLAEKGAVSVKRERIIEAKVTKEASGYRDEFPEEALVRRISSAGRMRISSINDQIALGWAKRNGWIRVDSGSVTLTEAGKKATSGAGYAQRSALCSLIKGEDPSSVMAKAKDAWTTLIKRNLIEVKEATAITDATPTKVGIDMHAGAPAAGVGELTREMISSGSWRKQKFREYDVNAQTESAYPARLHPVREFTNRIRQKWFEMGFIEVEGPIIESAFWNFDALFSPQDHPTREMQDTFYLSNPKQLSIDDVELIGRVKKMHLEGWKEGWSEQLARSPVLRTHTTSVSARYMKKLAKAAESSYPAKLFSIGSVFRNEATDYKHLAELRQYDGIIVGDNLTMANLIHTLKSFYARLGLDDVKLAPSYFPFTEPSLGFFYYDEKRGDIIELCGGGIIRKEITKAMGLNKTVLAWGGGVDRLLLNDKIFGVGTLPELYKNDIAWLRSRGGIKV